jgi:hypothetical protein
MGGATAVDQGRSLLGHNCNGHFRPFRELHNCSNPLGDATRHPTPDAELPALSAGVVRAAGGFLGEWV